MPVYETFNDHVMGAAVKARRMVEERVRVLMAKHEVPRHRPSFTIAIWRAVQEFTLPLIGELV